MTDDELVALGQICNLADCLWRPRKWCLSIMSISSVDGWHDVPVAQGLTYSQFIPRYAYSCKAQLHCEHHISYTNQIVCTAARGEWRTGQTDRRRAKSEL